MSEVYPNFSIKILSFVRIIQKMPSYMALNKTRVVMRTQLRQHQ